MSLPTSVFHCRFWTSDGANVLTTSTETQALRLHGNSAHSSAVSKQRPREHQHELVLSQRELTPKGWEARHPLSVSRQPTIDSLSRSEKPFRQAIKYLLRKVPPTVFSGAAQHIQRSKFRRVADPLLRLIDVLDTMGGHLVGALRIVAIQSVHAGWAIRYIHRS